MPTPASIGVSDDFLVFTRAPPSPAQLRTAYVVVPVLLLIVFCVTRPFANVQFRPLTAFVPFYVTGLFLNGLITATLLFAQFSILRTRALLVAANGYIFSALMIIPYTLSFPGVFEPERPLLGGLQSTAAIYIVRHCGIALFLTAFASYEGPGADALRWQGNVGRAIAASVTVTTSIVLLLAIACIGGHSMLPAFAVNYFQFGASWISVAGLPIGTLYVLALAVLWPKRHTVLGLWLMVVAFVHLVGVLYFYPPSSRYSVGWYTVTLLNLSANSLVLVVLLVELLKLYARVLTAVQAQQREREARLITGDAVSAMIAHEVKQPLAAMITRAETSLRRLGNEVPDLNSASEDMRRVAADGRRACTVIDAIRANFKKEARIRTMFDLNVLIEETAALVRDELQRHRIAVDAEFAADLQELSGDRTQLQQVLLNLINNAVDAMAQEAGPRVLLLKSEAGDDGHVVISVADTGQGFGPHGPERIFNPLVTTKPDGMGMGLSICRSIIEAHDGRIWALPGEPKGAVFCFSLPFAVDNPEEGVMTSQVASS